MSRRSILVLGLAVLLLALVAGTGWATWGATWRTGFHTLRSVNATATATRTPRAVAVIPTPVPLDLVIVVPTATPLPTQTPAPAAATQPVPSRPPESLAAIAHEYGMDPARRFIVVDLDTQVMTIWDPDGPVLREIAVSTGDETRGYRTLAWYGLVGEYWGTFSSFGVYADEGWYLFEDAGSILIHGAPYRLDNGQKIYEELDALGAYPASRGCIRLSPEDARWFTEWRPSGVPIAILPRAAG